jgi:SPP1 family predicted phage head-tail adaptor
MERIWNRNEILGRMNQRIQFQTVTETRSASGAVTETWSVFATVWAAVDMKAGNESQMLDKQTVKETTEFTIRYRTDINRKAVY